MSSSTLFLLKVAEGPLFRFAFALLVLGLLRAGLLVAWNTLGAYVAIRDPAEFRRKLRLRVLWVVLPNLVLRRVFPPGHVGMLVYRLALSFVGLIFRLGVIVLPAFMVAHVYLWERGLGVSWPALPGRIADVLALVTITAGVLSFLGRIYSPVVRRIEPLWTFLKPLILMVPFVTGVLAMHPTWSVVDYHVVRLLHVVSAACVFVLIPFARMLSGMHTPLTRLIPEAAWEARDAARGAQAAAPVAAAGATK